MFQWNEEIATGVALVDSQHRMLISYVNRLEELHIACGLWLKRHILRTDMQLRFAPTQIAGEYPLA
jgi:hemerythrin